MRAASRALLALALALPAGAARAQVQQNDPNAANASFALQGQLRAFNQQRVTDYNTLNQSIQRNVQFGASGPALPSDATASSGAAAASTRACAPAAERPGYLRRAGTARKKPFPASRLRPETGPMVACA